MPSRNLFTALIMVFRPVHRRRSCSTGAVNGLTTNRGDLHGITNAFATNLSTLVRPAGVAAVDSPARSAPALLTLSAVSRAIFIQISGFNRVTSSPIGDAIEIPARSTFRFIKFSNFRRRCLKGNVCDETYIETWRCMNNRLRNFTREEYRCRIRHDESCFRFSLDIRLCHSRN